LTKLIINETYYNLFVVIYNDFKVFWTIAYLLLKVFTIIQ